MHERCPACGTRFERAPGYFVGSMYISYAIAVAILVAMLVLFQLPPLRAAPLPLAVAAAVVVYLLLVPSVFRWSRILWIHLGERIGW